MKKHQKILIGLMALGLVGGIGTTLALTRTGANSTVDGQGTDQAIYLNWGTEKQNTALKTEIKDLSAKVAQYRCLVVAPKASATLSGTVNLTFTLGVKDKTELPGLSVNVYSVAEYTTEAVTVTEDGKNIKVGTLAIGDSTSVLKTSFDVGDSTATASFVTTKYYTLEFTWDGSGLTGTGTKFGGTLSIEQSFTKK